MRELEAWSVGQSCARPSPDHRAVPQKGNGREGEIVPRAKAEGGRDGHEDVGGEGERVEVDERAQEDVGVGDLQGRAGQGGQRQGVHATQTPWTLCRRAPTVALPPRLATCALASSCSPPSASAPLSGLTTVSFPSTLSPNAEV